MRRLQEELRLIQERCATFTGVKCDGYRKKAGSRVTVTGEM